MRVIVFASCAALLAAACGTVTGLSDDFQFVDDAGADGASSSSGGGGDSGSDSASDAGKDTGAQMCTVSQSMQANNDIGSASGDKLPVGCGLCLTSMCCPEVLDCFGKTTCRSTMDCVFSCQSRGSTQERQQCVSQCSGLSSFQAVTTCASNACRMTCGQLTP